MNFDMSTAPASAYPDVLKVSAVDRIQNTVGSYQLHRTLDVDVGHDPTLVVLNTAEAGEATAGHRPGHTQESAYAGVVPPYDVSDDHRAIFKVKLKKEETSSNTTSVPIIDEAKFSVVGTVRARGGFLSPTLMHVSSH